jgi:hypothetical protein
MTLGNSASGKAVQTPKHPAIICPRAALVETSSVSFRPNDWATRTPVPGLLYWQKEQPGDAVLKRRRIGSRKKCMSPN